MLTWLPSPLPHPLHPSPCCKNNSPLPLPYHIAPDKMYFFQLKIIDIFLFLHKNICCGYSLEVPHWGTSNEYPQHMFLWRNKKNIFLDNPLIWSYVPPKLTKKE